jgi:lipopolysaccharide transport system permease protein
MINQIEYYSQARDLLLAWTGRIIRGRYQQSIFGWLWAIIQPVATVTIFTIIFTRIVPIDTGNVPYPVFSYMAVVPWTLFAASLNDMAASLVQNMSLVTKIYFQREALPIAAMLARLMDFGVSAIILVMLMFAFRVPIYPAGWLYLPLIICIQLCLIVGLGLALSSLNVFFRDVQPMLTLVIQLWFYASPIIYPVALVPDGLRPFYFLNPMAGILEAYRAVLLYQKPPDTTLWTAGLVSLALFVVGWWFFRRVEFLFADII